MVAALGSARPAEESVFKTPICADSDWVDQLRRLVSVKAAGSVRWSRGGRGDALEGDKRQTTWLMHSVAAPRASIATIFFRPS
jgi:hypothetical protein